MYTYHGFYIMLIKPICRKSQIIKKFELRQIKSFNLYFKQNKKL